MTQTIRLLPTAGLCALAAYALYAYALALTSPECGTVVCAVLWG